MTAETEPRADTTNTALSYSDTSRSDQSTPLSEPGTLSIPVTSPFDPETPPSQLDALPSHPEASASDDDDTGSLVSLFDIPHNTSRMFYDLNIPYPPQEKLADLSYILAFASELGYNCVALSQNLPERFHANFASNAITLPPANVIVPDKMKLLTRVTLTIENAAHNHTVSLLPPVYDIVALRPTNEKAFTLCCLSLDCAIISLDLSERLPFLLKMRPVAVALQRGVRFEVCYSAGVLGLRTGGLANLIGGATALIRATQGRGIIVSSEARSALGLRAPMDMMNLTATWGLKPQRGKEAVCEESQKVVELARMKRDSFRGVIDVKNGGKPVAAKPDAAKPEVANQQVAKPQAGKPKAAKSQANKPQDKKAETEKTDTEMADAGKLQAKKPDPQKPETEKPEVQKPDTEMTDAEKLQASQPEASQPEAQKSDAEMTDAEEPQVDGSTEQAASGDPADMKRRPSITLSAAQLQDIETKGQSKNSKWRRNKRRKLVTDAKSAAKRDAKIVTKAEEEARTAAKEARTAETVAQQAVNAAKKAAKKAEAKVEAEAKAKAKAEAMTKAASGQA